MYDNICKLLAENFPADFARWLLGSPIPLSKLEPSELSAEPIRADSLIFLESADIILHLEFQTTTDENMPLRMLDYWVRIRRRFPTKQIHQTVIYLKPTNSPLVYQSSFISDQTQHPFNTIRLWEQPTTIFQQYLGLLPFVALSQTDDPEETLRQAAQQIEAITDRNLQANLAAATSIISGLKLGIEIIQRIIRRDIMRESTTYQAILAEGRAEGEARGEAKGLAEGKAEAANQIAINLLNAGAAVDFIAKVTGLSLEQIQQLQQQSRENLLE
ncbi:MAG: Rpn family recombination-promoting nuclease/putative transposase [Coleofasciculaceae cyanobacterium SM2_1_6]|nr:Rpn family recombination-promoting nuclease/putative transposase [Coleofasciculaceae cyanobacterium SM2_1_6]